MTLEKQRTLRLVKTILAISVCIGIFSITWAFQNKGEKETESAEIPHATTQGQATKETNDDSQTKSEQISPSDTDASSIDTVETAISDNEENTGEVDKAEDGTDANVANTAETVEASNSDDEESTDEVDKVEDDSDVNLVEPAETVEASNSDDEKSTGEANNIEDDTNANVTEPAETIEVSSSDGEESTSENSNYRDDISSGFKAALTEKVEMMSRGDDQLKKIDEDAASPGSMVDTIVSDDMAAQILSPVKQARPDLPIDNVRFSSIEGLYKATLQDNSVFFSSDGQFFIIGDMYQVKGQQLVNLQEEKRRKEEAAFAPQRAQMLDAIAREDMVIFPSIVNSKAYVYVFTDIDCGFCRKLHHQIPEMQTQGIEVRYLGFPRAGINSSSAQKLVTIWCSDNPREAMTLFKQEGNLPIIPCEPNPIANHYRLAQNIGILGTPSIVLSSGQIVSGAPSTEQLIEIMRKANLYQ